MSATDPTTNSGPNSPITAPPGIPSRQRHARLRRDDPESDLTHLPRNRGIIFIGKAARDHRAQNRFETAFQLLRQAGHLLRGPVNADHRRRDEKPQYGKVDTA